MKLNFLNYTTALWGKQPLFAEETGKVAENFPYLGLYKQGKACYNVQANKRTGGSMDRASDSGSEGWGFESLPVYQKSGCPFGQPLF